MSTFKKGDKVTATRYGKTDNYTVTQDQTSSVVLLTKDATKRQTWFHATSVNKIEKEG